MRNTMLTLTGLAAVLACLQGTPALALNNKSFVSDAGNDLSSCLNALNACATFAGALAKTAPGGEISVLNAGEYGPVTITQAANITNDGAGEAGILVPSGQTGITIVAGAGDIVSLRGLVIDGQGVGWIGIIITAASAVHIQNCVVRNLEGAGSSFGLVMLPSGNTQLFVSDTIVFNNGSVASTGGIAIEPLGTGNANVVLDRLHLENNVVGLLVNGASGTGNGAHVVIRDSVVSGNASDGILATSASGKAPAFVVVEHTSSIDNGGVGIHADGPRATMLLQENTVARNAVGIGAESSGQLISYRNNAINNNLGPDGAPTGFYSLN